MKKPEFIIVLVVGMVILMMFGFLIYKHYTPKTTVASDVVSENKTSAVDMAAHLEQEWNETKTIGNHLGVKMWSMTYKEEFTTIIKRAHANPKLLEAFMHAKRNGVTIYALNNFGVGSGWVDIDVRASDEEIIKFLMGE